MEPEVDKLMIFSETNIYILSKLVALVRRDTGRRHRLNSDDSIFKLLDDASLSSDERIQSYFTRFLDNLNAEQVLSFYNRGLTIPDQCMRRSGVYPYLIESQANASKG